MRGNGRFVYDFDEPSGGGRELLGGKGIGLAEMTQLGIPVPAGFTVTTDACREYMRNGKTLPRGLEDEIGRPFPQDAGEQLSRAVRAVFDSWETPRAQVYRRANRIADDLGTAVNVVQMVFGNKGDRSGTGVAFTRNPSTGANELYGEFLANAQGEDVVAGIRTPQPVESMADALPRAYGQLLDTLRKLEE